MNKILSCLVLVAALAVITIAATPAHKVDESIYDWKNRKRPVPEKHVFQTDYLGGTQIVFNHKKHAEDMEIACVECHHVEGCQHCHSKEVQTVDIAEAKVALHKNCYSCHEDYKCTDCHKQ